MGEPSQPCEEMQSVWQTQSWEGANTLGLSRCQEKWVQHKSEAMQCFSSWAWSSFILEWLQSYLADYCKGKCRRDHKAMQCTIDVLMTYVLITLTWGWPSHLLPWPQVFSPYIWTRGPVPTTTLHVIHKIFPCRVNLFDCYLEYSFFAFFFVSSWMHISPTWTFPSRPDQHTRKK